MVVRFTPQQVSPAVARIATHHAELVRHETLFSDPVGNYRTKIGNFRVATNIAGSTRLAGKTRVVLMTFTGAFARGLFLAARRLPMRRRRRRAELRIASTGCAGLLPTKGQDQRRVCAGVWTRRAAGRRRSIFALLRAISGNFKVRLNQFASPTRWPCRNCR
jgi:hypothetical protein